MYVERERQARWDKENICSASTRLPPETYENFRLLCALQGTTAYAVIKRLILAWMAEIVTAAEEP